jgi:acetolactate synthase-1/2/3 large subunit
MVDQGIAPLAVDLGAPDLPAAARALGGYGDALTGPDELVDALEAAFERSGPTVITVPEA